MTAARLIASDPPWDFRDGLPGATRGAANNYHTLSLAEIVRYPLPPIADDALLLLWRVAAMTSEAITVARAWGFEPKAELVWVKLATGGEGKLHFGMGRYTRGSHEVCMICAKGKAHALIQTHSIRSVFFAEVGKHSQKPDEFYRIAEELFPGPRVELFARTRRDGWQQFGLELEGGDAHP
jgi:N6-adenosine-specific RNA methylase IME4